MKRRQRPGLKRRQGIEALARESKSVTGPARESILKSFREFPLDRNRAGHFIPLEQAGFFGYDRNIRALIASKEYASATEVVLNVHGVIPVFHDITHKHLGYLMRENQAQKVQHPDGDPSRSTSSSDSLAVSSGQRAQQTKSRVGSVRQSPSANSLGPPVSPGVSQVVPSPSLPSGGRTSITTEAAAHPRTSHQRSQAQHGSRAMSGIETAASSAGAPVAERVMRHNKSDGTADSQNVDSGARSSSEPASSSSTSNVAHHDNKRMREVASSLFPAAESPNPVPRKSQKDSHSSVPGSILRTNDSDGGRSQSSAVATSGSLADLFSRLNLDLGLLTYLEENDVRDVETLKILTDAQLAEALGGGHVGVRAKLQWHLNIKSTNTTQTPQDVASALSMYSTLDQHHATTLFSVDPGTLFESNEEFSTRSTASTPPDGTEHDQHLIGDPSEEDDEDDEEEDGANINVVRTPSLSFSSDEEEGPNRALSPSKRKSVSFASLPDVIPDSEMILFELSEEGVHLPSPKRRRSLAAGDVSDENLQAGAKSRESHRVITSPTSILKNIHRSTTGAGMSPRHNAGSHGEEQSVVPMSDSPGASSTMHAHASRSTEEADSALNRSQPKVLPYVAASAKVPTKSAHAASEAYSTVDEDDEEEDFEIEEDRPAKKQPQPQEAPDGLYGGQNQNAPNLEDDCGEVHQLSPRQAESPLEDGEVRESPDQSQGEHEEDEPTSEEIERLWNAFLDKHSLFKVLRKFSKTHLRSAVKTCAKRLAQANRREGCPSRGLPLCGLLEEILGLSRPRESGRRSGVPRTGKKCAKMLNRFFILVDAAVDAVNEVEAKKFIRHFRIFIPTHGMLKVVQVAVAEGIVCTFRAINIWSMGDLLLDDNELWESVAFFIRFSHNDVVRLMLPKVEALLELSPQSYDDVLGACFLSAMTRADGTLQRDALDYFKRSCKEYNVHIGDVEAPDIDFPESADVLDAVEVILYVGTARCSTKWKGVGRLQLVKHNDGEPDEQFCLYVVSSKSGAVLRKKTLFVDSADVEYGTNLFGDTRETMIQWHDFTRTDSTVVCQVLGEDAVEQTATMMGKIAHLSRTNGEFVSNSHDNQRYRPKFLGNKNYKRTPYLIGRGAHGAVFIATDDTGAKYAAKFVEIGPGNDEWPMREIHAHSVTSQLECPHIAHCHSVELDTVNRQARFVLQLVKLTLRKAVKTKGPFAQHLARKLTRQLVAAELYLHSKGIHHRDEKPTNILIDMEAEKVYLIDFGTCSYGPDEDGLFTEGAGTTPWRAPETFISNDYDVKIAAWYTLGLVYYFMRTGEEPEMPRGKNNPALKSRVTIPGGWSEAERAFVTRALDPVPDKRAKLDADEFLRGA